jgi:SAM-dependent methyltransferase
MLDLARAKPEGGLVCWIEADARSLDLGERFDLVCMTGHAFQTLLTEADRAAGLATIARHLSPGGRFFFDSRNPLAQEWRDWTEPRSRDAVPHPEHGMVPRWTEAEIEAGIVTYTTEYRLASGRALTARSPIAFAPQAELARLIAAAGLRVAHWYGSTEGAAYTEASPEIIPVGTLG